MDEYWLVVGNALMHAIQNAGFVQQIEKFDAFIGGVVNRYVNDVVCLAMVVVHADDYQRKFVIIVYRFIITNTEVVDNFIVCIGI
jgi:hypothetical protein